MKPILKCQNLSKKYIAGGTEYLALDDVELEVFRGEFCAIIGKSGSGKSTLLHLLSGLDKPTGGTVFIGNQDINKMNDSDISKLRRKKIGFIFQAYNLLPELCVEENIKMPLYLDKKAQNKNYVNMLMKKMGLYGSRLKFPSQLSGGEQQRVAIARALVMEPDIIFADEPTGNLDQKTGQDILELFQFMRSEFNQTILLVTHDMDVARRASRIIEIKDGKIARG